MRSQQPGTRTVSPVVSCCIGHSYSSWWHSWGTVTHGVTVGEQYQQLWEAASEAERRPKKYAEEQEIDQLDLDHAEQGILVDFHTKKKKITTLDIKAEMTLAAKWGKKNPTTCSFSSHCKSREPNTSRLFYVSTPAARPFKYLYKGPR